MQASMIGVAGHLRAGPDSEWAAADYSLSDGFLEARPTSGGAADHGSPVVRWPLAEIQHVTELVPSHDGRMVVELTLAGGAGFEAAIPVAFVADLCARLARASAVRPPSPAASAPPPPPGVPGRAAPPMVGGQVASHPAAPATHVQAQGPPSAGAVAPPVAPAHQAEPATVGRGRVLIAVVGATVVVALLAGIGILWQRASQERERAEAAERSLAELTEQLRSTQSELATTTERLATADGEVEDLTLRVSELSNEKAQVQDERNAAQELNRLGADAASRMLDCRDQVLLALDYVLDEYYLSASDVLESAVPICNAADDAVAAFSAAL